MKISRMQSDIFYGVDQVETVVNGENEKFHQYQYIE